MKSTLFILLFLFGFLMTPFSPLSAQTFGEWVETFSGQLSKPVDEKGNPAQHVRFSENGNLPCRVMYQFTTARTIHHYDFYPANMDTTLQIGGGMDGAYIAIHFQPGHEALHTTVRKRDQKELTARTEAEFRFYFPDIHVARRAALSLQAMIQAGNTCLEEEKHQTPGKHRMPPSSSARINR